MRSELAQEREAAQGRKRRAVGPGVVGSRGVGVPGGERVKRGVGPPTSSGNRGPGTPRGQACSSAQTGADREHDHTHTHENQRRAIGQRTGANRPPQTQPQALHGEGGQ